MSTATDVDPKRVGEEEIPYALWRGAVETVKERRRSGISPQMLAWAIETLGREHLCLQVMPASEAWVRLVRASAVAAGDASGEAYVVCAATRTERLLRELGFASKRERLRRSIHGELRRRSVKGELTAPTELVRARDLVGQGALSELVEGTDGIRFAAATRAAAAPDAARKRAWKAIGLGAPELLRELAQPEMSPEWARQRCRRLAAEHRSASGPGTAEIERAIATVGVAALRSALHRCERWGKVCADAAATDPGHSEAWASLAACRPRQLFDRLRGSAPPGPTPVVRIRTAAGEREMPLAAAGELLHRELGL
ncbi:MAG: hypothetical protein ACR2K6_02935 [Solirubrobacterales bacterium]